MHPSDPHSSPDRALSQMPVLSVSDITISYGGDIAADHISFSLPKGCIAGIIGPNGAGKSTLLKGIMGLIPVSAGSALFEGTPFSKQRGRIAYVAQRSAVDLSFPISVEETVLLGTYPKLGVLHRPKRAEREAARLALERVSLPHCAKRQIGQLSGGQLQRVFLARALVQQADLLLLDEPFAGIDASSEALMMSLLRDLANEGKTILIVHHDLHKVRDYFSQLVVLNRACVAFGETETVLTRQVLQTAYGDAMDVLFQSGGAPIC